MGLRTASVRRPCAEVMAPALTETTQSQTFKLAPKEQPASPLARFDSAKCLPDVELDHHLAAGQTCSDADVIMTDSPTSMGDQTTKMGLQKTADTDSVAKINDKPNEVDQILNNLTSNLTAADVDLPQNVDELMQVIKSIESNPSNELEDNLTIEKFLTDVDMMNMSMEDQQEIEAANLKEVQTKEQIAELKKRQNKIERRLDFLRRKIRKIQARNMGQHVGNEVAGVYEYVHRSLKRLKDSSLQQQMDMPAAISSDDKDNKEKMKPMSLGSTKTLLKKLEMAAALQANSASRQKHLPKYFGSGSCEPANSRITVPGIVNVPPWPIEHKQELQKVTGLLHSELTMVQHEVDSEATESSSGGESCDEMQNYNNPHQQYLSIQKRALWKYSTARAAIAGRWTWLQAQISDLEYRIRQHTDLQRQIRSSKGEIQLGGASPPPIAAASTTTTNNNNNNISTTSSPPSAVNGYRGQLPGGSPVSSLKTELTDTITTSSSTTTTTPPTTTANGACVDYQCARTRPLINFKKRRLLQINGLHVISKKACRPSTVRCGCVQTTAPCAVCTGRTDPTHPRDPPDALSKAERIALVDPAFHPVFSLPEDISYGVHCEAIMKNPEWQQRSTRMKSLKILKNDRSDKSVLEHRSKKLDHRKKYNRLLKPSTVSALSAKIKNKIRGRKLGGRHSSSSSTTSTFRKRSKLSTSSQLHSLSGADGADEEVESIGNNSNAAATNSAAGSPSSSPLLQMQAISGYNRRTRTNSYDIDNIVIPYSVAAATRVEKLQYKEILTPKWRIADIDFNKSETKNNGAVRNPSQDSDVEDLSEEAVIARHDKSEYEEKKKFLSYLKLPTGHGRSRAHKRTDSLAESSGANTPDPMSPHPIDHPESVNSPLTSPPATPLPLPEESTTTTTTTAAAMRRRTVSQSKLAAVAGGGGREENTSTPEAVEVTPYEPRTFPLDEETYEKMLKNMPENHQFTTNVRAQDPGDYHHQMAYLDEKIDSPGSESTESAIGEEDPNDPEWVEMERSRDRHKR